MSKVSLVWSRLLFILCASVTAASAQTETTGAIQGTVYYYEAAMRQPIVNAIVTVRNQETGLERSTRSNNSGLYRIDILPPGFYSVSAVAEGYETTPDSTTNNFQVFLKTNLVQPPPIVLRKLSAAAAPAPTVRPTTTSTITTTAGSAAGAQAEQLVNTLNAARGGNFDARQLTSLPLPEIRSFETLAFLLPGVAPPPPPLSGSVGPDVGPGIGTAGQFAVNGLRARANNFTVDGSDNNDEDVGVRRHGFVALVPQSVESVQEFQLFTHLWDAGVGRNLGSQVNAVSRSGGNRVHGVLYDFFNHHALNARNFFDYTSERAPSYELTALTRLANGSTERRRVLVRDANLINNSQVPVLGPPAPIVQTNPAEGKDFYQRNQGGAAIGFPLRRDRTFFFGSFERQDIKARQETHFAVPTVAQRGVFGSGATGLRVPVSTPFGTFNFDDNPTPAPFAGDFVFSLFPFPNNAPNGPAGPYGENTFTQVLPADATGTIFSLKLDHNFKLFGPDIAHTLTGRYNFTNDQRQVPAVGGALFSSIEPRLGTQNLSLLLDTHLGSGRANQLRGSYGRTRLRFQPLANPLTVPSFFLPDVPFLVNRPQSLLNATQPGDPVVTYLRRKENGIDTTAEEGLGPIGQMVIPPFSPVGLDVYLFPQARVNNTYQLADTFTLFRGNHSLKFGADLRRTQLNSRVDRNFRPQLVFAGAPDLPGDSRLNTLLPELAQLPALLRGLSRFGPTPRFFTGLDLAAVSLTSNFFQSVALDTTPGQTLSQFDSTIGLRFWQYNFFFNDNWRVRPGLTLDYGLRYEFNTVPREVDQRIENTFRLDQVPPADPSVTIFVPFTNRRLAFNTQQALASFNDTLAALDRIIGDRRTIYDADRNNFGPHLGFAWDPFAGQAERAGKTVLRGGAGVYYDVTLGSVVSQSRNVFPNFIPINIGANTLFFLTDILLNSRGPVPLACVDSEVLSPSRTPFEISIGNQTACYNLSRVNTLNILGIPPAALRPFLGALFDPARAGLGVPGLQEVLPAGSVGSLAFTLPDRKLRTPYSLHFNLQFERELFPGYLANLAYIGTRGLKLTRFRTPNGGPNSLTFPVDPFQVCTDPLIALLIGCPSRGLPSYFTLPALSELSANSRRLSRPIRALGSYNIFDSSASSTYHSLQASLSKRFTGGNQFTVAYTWSHAIDDVSDVFDLAGAYTLPQDDRNLRAERGDANFDLRHRLAFSFNVMLPWSRRFDSARGAAGLLLGGWQLAAISAYQTGQPFTVNTSFDVNLDGNLTDRPDALAPIRRVSEGRQRVRLDMSNTVDLLAPLGTNGRVGRNLFRAARVIKTDISLIKNFRLRNEQVIVLRVEAFNLFNRAQFGIPVRILEAPSFGQAVDTVLPARQIQFALKFVF